MKLPFDDGDKLDSWSLKQRRGEDPGPEPCCCVRRSTAAREDPNLRLGRRSGGLGCLPQAFRLQRCLRLTPSLSAPRGPGPRRCAGSGGKPELPWRSSLMAHSTRGCRAAMARRAPGKLRKAAVGESPTISELRAQSLAAASRHVLGLARLHRLAARLSVAAFAGLELLLSQPPARTQAKLLSPHRCSRPARILIVEEDGCAAWPRKSVCSPQPDTCWVPHNNKAAKCLQRYQLSFSHEG